MEYKQGVAVARGILESFFLVTTCTGNTVLQQASQSKAGRIFALVAILHDPGYAQAHVRCDYVLLSPCLRWLRLIIQPKPFLKDLRAEAESCLKASMLLFLQQE